MHLGSSWAHLRCGLSTKFVHGSGPVQDELGLFGSGLGSGQDKLGQIGCMLAQATTRMQL